MWTHILAFAAGAAIGAAIGFITRTKDDDAFEERVAEEVIAFKRRYKELHEEASTAPANGEPQREEVKDVAESTEEAEVRKSYDTAETTADVTVSPTGRGVYEITESEFIDNPQPETETLLYYTLDGTVASTDEEIIPGVESLIGESYVTLDPDDCLYVRNLDVGVDYEIQAVPYSYKEYVLGE